MIKQISEVWAQQSNVYTDVLAVALSNHFHLIIKGEFNNKAALDEESNTNKERNKPDFWPTALSFSLVLISIHSIDWMDDVLLAIILNFHDFCVPKGNLCVLMKSNFFLEVIFAKKCAYFPHCGESLSVDLSGLVDVIHFLKARWFQRFPSKGGLFLLKSSTYKVWSLPKILDDS